MFVEKCTCSSSIFFLKAFLDLIGSITSAAEDEMDPAIRTKRPHLLLLPRILLLPGKVSIFESFEKKLQVQFFQVSGLIHQKSSITDF